MFYRIIRNLVNNKVKQYKKRFVLCQNQAHRHNNSIQKVFKNFRQKSYFVISKNAAIKQQTTFKNLERHNLVSVDRRSLTTLKMKYGAFFYFSLAIIYTIDYLYSQNGNFFHIYDISIYSKD